jgi:hypothetical protein
MHAKAMYFIIMFFNSDGFITHCDMKIGRNRLQILWEIIRFASIASHPSLGRHIPVIKACSPQSNHLQSMPNWLVWAADMIKAKAFTMFNPPRPDIYSNYCSGYPITSWLLGHLGSHLGHWHCFIGGWGGGHFIGVKYALYLKHCFKLHMKRLTFCKLSLSPSGLIIDDEIEHLGIPVPDWVGDNWI